MADTILMQIPVDTAFDFGAEHMLFYANKKYPEEGAYNLYLAEVHTRVSEISCNGCLIGI